MLSSVHPPQETRERLTARCSTAVESPCCSDNSRHPLRTPPGAHIICSHQLLLVGTSQMPRKSKARAQGPSTPSTHFRHATEDPNFLVPEYEPTPAPISLKEHKAFNTLRTQKAGDHAQNRKWLPRASFEQLQPLATYKAFHSLTPTKQLHHPPNKAVHSLPSATPTPSQAQETTGPAQRPPPERGGSDTTPTSNPYSSSRDNLPILTGGSISASYHQSHSRKPIIRTPRTPTALPRPQPAAPAP